MNTAEIVVHVRRGPLGMRIGAGSYLNKRGGWAVPSVSCPPNCATALQGAPRAFRTELSFPCSTEFATATRPSLCGSAQPSALWRLASHGHSAWADNSTDSKAGHFTIQ